MDEPQATGGQLGRYAERVANAFGLVLLLVIATYVLTSLTGYVGWTAVVVSAVGSVAGAVALATAEARKLVVRLAFALAAGAVVLAITAELTGETALLAIAALIQTILLAAAALAVLRAVILEPEVSSRTILGAISVYMIFGLLFMFTYVAVDGLQPGPFFSAPRGTGDFIFFSFTTLTTTGYGNLVPLGQPGKMLAGLEMLLGQIFLVTLIAGLVSQWRPRSRR